MRSAPFVLPTPGPVCCPDFPRTRKCHPTPARTTSERVPVSLQYKGFVGPALYRFVIYSPNQSVSAFYYGETGNLAKRIGHYCGMVRRLLALHTPGLLILVEKHPMRHIHYHLAEALLTPGAHVQFSSWRLPSGLCNAKQEQLESRARDRFSKLHPPAAVIYSRGKGNFESKPPLTLSSQWQSVHKRLTKFSPRASSVII